MCSAHACPGHKAFLALGSRCDFYYKGEPEHVAVQDVRAANVKALTDGALLALHRDDFNALLGSLTHIRHMWRFEALRKVCASTSSPKCQA